MTPLLGWDVGGANVKCALLDGRRPEMRVHVAERAFPLWREPNRLPEVLGGMAREQTRVLSGAPPGGVTEMAVTMTAELADCFATKRDGVHFVLDAFGQAFPDAEVHVYAVDGRFRSPEAARAEPLRVAAANWMASATLAAREFPDALFLDVGSTTTDIVPIAGGRVMARGRHDTERLAAGEMVYTGALRTPVCAIVQTVPVGGQPCRVAAEHFAVAADAHLWLGRIRATDYTCETPDGRGRSRPEAGARLARVVCADSELMDEADITAIAAAVAAAQVRMIVEGITQVLEGIRPWKPRLALVAGNGAFMARDAVRDAGLDFRDRARDASPAAAVARLWAEAGLRQRTGE